MRTQFDNAEIKGLEGGLAPEGQILTSPSACMPGLAPCLRLLIVLYHLAYL